MNLMSYKFQIVCLIILIYITYCYILSHAEKEKKRSRIYVYLLAVSYMNVFLDMATVYTVNHLETVNAGLNRFLHLLFLISIISFEFLVFLYITELCRLDISSLKLKILVYMPYIAGVILVIANINNLEYKIGVYTNYSMGNSAYVSYGIGFVYFAVSIIIFLGRIRFIAKNKQKILIFSNMVVVGTIIVQMIYPEILISCMAIMVIVMAFYQSIENGVDENNDRQQRGMIHTFADIVESRDGCTGEHVKRTTDYVELIAQELRKMPKFKNVMTQDYIDALMIAAPMHDIGKIAIPDSILKKPGKLTADEYNMIKEHTTEGAKLINGSLEITNELYRRILYEIAYYHHERWNGSGYPLGIKGEDIPLSARIMSIADVFDAVSQDRCYRKAMTLDESFDIIKDGIGTEFDPVIAKCFLDNRVKVEEVYGRLSV